MKLAALVPLLVRDFDAGAFTPDSLAYVARRCQYFPTYYEICQHLGAWWSDHRPLPLAIAAPPVVTPPRPEPTPEEREYVHARVQEVLAAIHAPAARDRPEPTPRYLTPAQLDIANPLPDGRKRVQAEATGWERDHA